MEELERKQAAQHLDLYRIDGRSYDLSEEDGVLTLQLRRSVRWERFAVSVLAAFLVLLYGLAMLWYRRTWWPTSFSGFEESLAFQLFALIPMQIAIQFAFAMRRDETWRIDKNAAEITCNKGRFADTSKIRSVRAWRRGRRLYIAFKLSYGQTLKLGRFAFCRSERAWRDDAAQIAAFLGVPLEIPPVVD